MEEPRQKTYLFLWNGQGLYLGPGRDSSIHQHYAIQIGISFEQPFLLRYHAHDPFTAIPCFFIAPNRPHQILTLTHFHGVSKHVYTEHERGTTWKLERESLPLSLNEMLWTWSNAVENRWLRLARELGISDNTLQGWKQQMRAHGTDAFPASGHQTPPEEELHRLKREIEILRQERDILKKALAIFSRTER